MTMTVPPSPRTAGDGDDDEPTLDQVILDYLAAQRGRAHLVLRAVGKHDFVYGSEAEISISAVDSQSNTAAAGGRDHGALQIDLGTAPVGPRRGRDR